MKILKAEFIKSADCLKNCPKSHLPEIALIGRSNVGKSSFINKFCNRKHLAKTSNTPGKTKLLNYFNINDELIIVDLPGYGYAKVPRTEQDRWKKELENYILNRENLTYVIQFIDARHEVQKNDLQMREWLKHNNIKMLTVATKIDSLKKSQIPPKIKEFTQVLNTEVIAFSAKTGVGVKEVSNLMQNFKS